MTRVGLVLLVRQATTMSIIKFLTIRLYIHILIINNKIFIFIQISDMVQDNTTDSDNGESNVPGRMSEFIGKQYD